MSQPPPPVREEDLHGLVDGELEPGQREALLRYLAEAPADAARIEDWRRQNETIRAAFARVTAETLPFGLALATPRHGLPCKLLPRREALIGKADAGLEMGLDGGRRPLQTLWIILAFVSGLAVALGASQLAGRFADSAMPDQGLGVAASGDDRLIERTRSAFDTSTRRQSGDLGILGTLIVPNLSGAGLDFSAARIFPGGEGASLCMIYAIKPSTEAVLCVEESSGVDSTGFEISEMLGLRTISWRQSGARYALTTSLSEDVLRDIAARARAEVAAFDRR